MKFLLSIPVVLLAASSSVQASCDIADGRYYLHANVEAFPASADSEISYAQAKALDKTGGVYYEIDQLRCDNKTLRLFKFQGGKPIYGYEYVYENGVVSSLKLLYIDGRATSYEKALNI